MQRESRGDPHLRRALKAEQDLASMRELPRTAESNRSTLTAENKRLKGQLAAAMTKANAVLEERANAVARIKSKAMWSLEATKL